MLGQRDVMAEVLSPQPRAKPTNAEALAEQVKEPAQAKPLNLAGIPNIAPKADPKKKVQVSKLPKLTVYLSKDTLSELDEACFWINQGNVGQGSRRLGKNEALALIIRDAVARLRKPV